MFLVADVTNYKRVNLIAEPVHIVYCDVNEDTLTYMFIYNPPSFYYITYIISLLQIDCTIFQ